MAPTPSQRKWTSDGFIWLLIYGSIFKSEFIIQFRTKNSNKDKSKKDYDVIFSKYCKVSTLLNAEVTGDNFNKLTGSSEEEQKKIQGN